MEEEKIIVEEENNIEQKEKLKPNGLGVAGVILNIIGGISIFYFSIICFVAGGGLIILGLILLCGSIIQIIINSIFLGDYDLKIGAGVMGLIFGGILGGIFVLCCDKKIF